MSKKAYLVLQNGQVFEGERFGADVDVTAEMVFNTAVVGYLETMTDPCYQGQMVVQTFPLLGNYGVIEEDFELPRAGLSAFVVREICDEPSNFRCEGKLADYMEKMDVAGISGVDTRQLTRLLRDHGCMNAAIVSQLPEDVALFASKLAAKPGKADVHKVCCSESYTVGEGEKHVVAWDFGQCKSMVDAMVQRGCRVTVVPANTTAETIAALNPNALLLTNGPGDPAVNEAIVENIKKLIPANIPMFGVGLGHQLLALAMGAKTCRHPYGHRGSNQPVRDMENGRLYITSQNHGYVVDEASLPEGASVRMENVNDGTCEGIDYENIPAFSVQFCPQAGVGPRSTAYLYDRLIERMGGN